MGDLHRRAEICEAVNGRYLEALASVRAGGSAGAVAKRVCQPIVKDGRRQRGLNPWAEQRRQSGRVTWALARLRAHGIIKKVGGSYRYQLTPALMGDP